MRRWEDFSNFFFATKTSNIGAHFAPTINSFDAPGTFDTPDSDFRDLLDELFNLNIKPQNRKKSNLRKLFFGPLYNITYIISSNELKILYLSEEFVNLRCEIII